MNALLIFAYSLAVISLVQGSVALYEEWFLIKEIKRKQRLGNVEKKRKVKIFYTKLSLLVLSFFFSAATIWVGTGIQARPRFKIRNYKLWPLVPDQIPVADLDIINIGNEAANLKSIKVVFWLGNRISKDSIEKIAANQKFNTNVYIDKSLVEPGGTLLPRVHDPRPICPTCATAYTSGQLFAYIKTEIVYVYADKPHLQYALVHVARIGKEGRFFSVFQEFSQEEIKTVLTATIKHKNSRQDNLTAQFQDGEKDYRF